MSKIFKVILAVLITFGVASCEIMEDIDKQDKDGNTLLMLAIQKRVDNSREIQLLIKNGADVNIGNNYKKTPLMEAVSKRKEITKLLLDNEAEVDEKDAHGKTALILAASKSRLAIMELLIEYGADVHIKDNEGNTALSQIPESKIAKFLKDSGAKE